MSPSFSDTLPVVFCPSLSEYQGPTSVTVGGGREGRRKEREGGRQEGEGGRVEEGEGGRQGGGRRGRETGRGGRRGREGGGVSTIFLSHYKNA